MTASISIAITKPRTKRTAKGLILSGANGKRARHDGRHPEHADQSEFYWCSKPTIDDSNAITESLDGDLPTSLVDMSRSERHTLNRAIYTTESPDFVCGPNRRRRVRNADRKAKLPAPRFSEPPQFDEAGRPIVYVSSCDAWNLRVYR